MLLHYLPRLREASKTYKTMKERNSCPVKRNWALVASQSASFSSTLETIWPAIDWTPSYWPSNHQLAAAWHLSLFLVTPPHHPLVSWEWKIYHLTVYLKRGSEIVIAIIFQQHCVQHQCLMLLYTVVDLFNHSISPFASKCTLCAHGVELLHFQKAPSMLSL